MRRRGFLISTVFLAGMLCSAADTPKKADTPVPIQAGAAPSLALSPGVLEVKARAGASSTYVLALSNLMDARLAFVLEAYDVVVRDGKRTFVPAGETEGGIARSAVFDPTTIELNPGETGKVKVTLTVPDQPKVRAVVAIFRGQTALRGTGAVMFTGSLGTLITYNLSSDVKVRVGAPTLKPQTVTSNLVVSEQFENEGQEPAVPRGTLAILKSTGQLVGRVAIEPHRLLPGEGFNCEIEYPHGLRTGKYHAMISIQHEGGVESRGLDFEIE